MEEYLTAGLPDSETQKFLGLKRESPIIVIERKAFSVNDRVVEIRRSVGRADHTTIEFDCDLTEGLLLEPIVNLSRTASDFVANSR